MLFKDDHNDNSLTEELKSNEGNQPNLSNEMFYKLFILSILIIIQETMKYNWFQVKITILYKFIALIYYFKSGRGEKRRHCGYQSRSYKSDLSISQHAG